MYHYWWAMQLKVEAARSTGNGFSASSPTAGTIDIKLAGALLFVPLVLLLVFAILITGSSPEPDDFGIATSWRESGLPQTLREMYLSWSGRLPGIGLSLLPFALENFTGMDLLLAYRLCCAVTFVGIVAVSLWCAQLLLWERPRLERLLFGLLFAVSIVVGAPAPESVVLRFNEAGFYAIPGLALFAIALWLAARAEQRIGLVQAGVLSIVSFLVALSSEFSGIVLILLIGCSLLQRCLIRVGPRQYGVHAALLAITILGIVVVVLAPGNAFRLNALGIHEPIIFRAISTIPSTIFDVAIFLFRRLTNPALLGATVTLLIVTSQYPKQIYPAKPLILIFVPLVTGLTVIAVGLWIGRVATGEMLVQRAQNELHFVLVASLAITSILTSRFGYKNRFMEVLIARFQFLKLQTAIVVLSFVMLLTPKFLTAAKIVGLNFGDYSRSVTERFALITSASADPIRQKDVVLPRLSYTNALFQEPLREDPRYWTNQLLARYMGARSAKIEGRN